MKQISKLMKQAQQMQENMQKMQEELGQQEVNGESGGGMVKVTMNCRHEVKSIKIDDQVISDDKDMLEDLVAAALNDAVRKVDETTKEKFSGLTGGMNIPGLNLPF
ncbi:MAG: YbaB/EbfC family nucleoid-associated protein [Gammaproteobacteria bacterium]|nr:YbaB/EbfC family nucleoid-associated protein [Gammaproteobacteria bacterium]NNF67578.1 YbaB/EbfC family nucleoid-associated protein [Gammaproteobacteria bacterium]